MIRKKLALLILSLCAIFLVGCEKVVELTDEETRLIAEYAAELLLKYDINYVDRIDEGNQKAEEMSSEALDKIINGETTTGKITTEDNVKQESTTEKNEDMNRHDSQSEVDIKEEEEHTIGTEQDIAVIAGIQGAKITFREYFVVDEYPETEEQGDFIHLEASQGYRLLVVRFDVENLTTDILPVSLIDKGLDYRIVCNSRKVAKPMLTILMDDLGTLEMNVEPDVPQQAVLVFQISEEMHNNLETMELYVTYNEIENMIKILQ